MATTPILGPIQNGVRLLFKVEITIPASYDASDGDAVITDTLPNGLSLYLNTGSTITDSKNSVTINTIDKTNNVTFSNTPNNICTIPTADISANDKVAVIFDAVITDTASITADTDITNYSSITFSSAAGKYAASTADTTFKLTNTTNIIRTSPTAPVNVYALPAIIAYNYEFTASSNTGAFNYFIENDFGNNLDLAFTDDNKPILSAHYDDDAIANNIPLDYLPKEAGAQIYTFIFPNNPLYANKKIRILYTASSKNLVSGTNVLSDSVNLSIGGAIGVNEPQTTTIIVN